MELSADFFIDQLELKLGQMKVLREEFSYVVMFHQLKEIWKAKNLTQIKVKKDQQTSLSFVGEQKRIAYLTNLIMERALVQH